MASNGVMARRSFHRIWIAGKKPLVKRAPGTQPKLMNEDVYVYHDAVYNNDDEEDFCGQ